jgi:hypothetical protein
MKNMSLEHPSITQANKTGYANVVSQPEHAGRDFFGNELLVGDDVVEFDGEMVHRDNLYEFLEALGFEFKTL